MAYSPAGADWEVSVSSPEDLEKAIANYCSTNNIITNATADPQAALDARINQFTTGATLAQTQGLVNLFLKAMTKAQKRTRT